VGESSTVLTFFSTWRRQPTRVSMARLERVM